MYNLTSSVVQWGITHNVGLDSSINFAGVDETEASQFFGLFESGDFTFYNAPSVTAGTAPTFSSFPSLDVKSSGLIGIGTSSPFATLSLQANASSTNQMLFAIGSTTNVAGTFLNDNSV